MRVSTAAVAVPFLLLLLTWLLLSGLNLNSSLFDRQLRALDDFAMIENALHRDVRPHVPAYCVTTTRW